jgi:hypothetical protein
MRYALPCASDDRSASKLPDHVRLFCLALSDEKTFPALPLDTTTVTSR